MKATGFAELAGANLVHPEIRNCRIDTLAIECRRQPGRRNALRPWNGNGFRHREETSLKGSSAHQVSDLYMTAPGADTVGPEDYKTFGRIESGKRISSIDRFERRCPRHDSSHAPDAVTIVTWALDLDLCAKSVEDFDFLMIAD